MDSGNMDSAVSLQRFFEIQCAQLGGDVSKCMENVKASVGQDTFVTPSTMSPICLLNGPCGQPETCSKSYFSCLETPETINKGYVCDDRFQLCVAQLSSSPLLAGAGRK
jgi:hypothetical protein